MMSKTIKYALLAVSAFAAASLQAQPEAHSGDFGLSKNMEILFNLFRELDMNYVDSLDPDELGRNAAAGMVYGLDPYTEFMTGEEMEQFSVMTTGRYGGIGSVIRQNGEWVDISEPYKGSAADKAGLEPGDRIIAIEGRTMRGANTTTVSNLMKGDPGTLLTITVEKFRTGLTQDVSIVRERVEIPSIAFWGMLDDSVGCIVYDVFSEDSAAAFKHAVMEMQNAGMRSLIVDLRGNAGGVLSEAVKIAGLFLPRNTEVVSLRARETVVKASFRTTSEPVAPDLRIALLLSGNSASASEVLAGALQDMDRAVLLGQRSYGKGLVQTPRSLGYNAYAKITTDKYYIPSGRSTQAIDYSARREDAGAARVPDSLVREFRTLGGRKVYDGGGVTPDIVTAPTYMSAFTVDLINRGYIDGFVLDYVRSSSFAPVDSVRFTLSDDDYARFVEYMQPRESGVKRASQAALEELRRTSAMEKNADSVAVHLDIIGRLMERDKTTELQRYRDEISRIIEDGIILYYYHSQGVVRHRLQYDPLVTQAAQVLGDDARYDAILHYPEPDPEPASDQ